MQVFSNKLICVLVEITGLIINIANAFLANIVVYETTNKIKFNYNLLLGNWTFWIIIVFQLVYFIICICVQQKNKKTDEVLKDAIARNEIKLITQATYFTKKEKFDSAREVIRILEQFEERRKK